MSPGTSGRRGAGLWAGRLLAVTASNAARVRRERSEASEASEREGIGEWGRVAHPCGPLLLAAGDSSMLPG